MQLEVDTYQSQLDRLIIIKQVDAITRKNSLFSLSNAKISSLTALCKYLISTKKYPNAVFCFIISAIYIVAYIIIAITYIYFWMTSIRVYMDSPE